VRDRDAHEARAVRRGLRVGRTSAWRAVGVSLWQRAAGAMGGALAIRAGGAAVQLGVSVVLARLLGAERLAAYYLFVAWSTLLGTLVGLGLPFWSMRATAVLRAEGRAEDAFAGWRRSSLWTVGVGLALAVPAHLMRVPIATLAWGAPGDAGLIAVAFWSAIPFALMTLAAETLKSCSRPHAALSLQYAAVPAAVGAFAVGGAVFSIDMSVGMVVAVYAAGLVVVALMTMDLVRRCLGVSLGGMLVGVGRAARPGAGSVAAFWMTTLLAQATVFVPYLVLPHVAGREAIGVFGAADRLVSVGSLTLIALASIYAPRFATAYHLRDATLLRRSLDETRIVGTVAYLPVFLVFAVAGEPVLRVFGNAFAAGWGILVALGLGQLANAGTGLVRQFNNMTHQEAFESVSTGVAVIGTILLCSAGGTLDGVQGLAVGVALSVTAKNLVSLARARRTIRLMEAGLVVD